MIKLIDIKAWIYSVVLGTYVFLTFLPEVKAFCAEYAPVLVWPISLLENVRVAAFVIAAFVSLVLLRWVWRGMWCLPLIGSYFSEKVFPDLNGLWDIEIHSNWPIIDTMQKAAADTQEPRVQVLGDPTILPPATIVKLQGELTQNWQQATLTIFPSEATPLRISRTLAFDLIQSTTGQPKRIGWIFRQENKEVAATDEETFLGAALLEVETSDRLFGRYWNNRSWRKGLNAAGEIIMTRRKLN